MFRNVMVPVDGSPFSREAVLQGLRLASLYGATLRLVRVASSPPYQAGPEAVLGLASVDAVHAEELAEIYAIAAECRAHSTIKVTASVERGPIVDALCGYARRNGVDVIVMRSHARTGLARAWFGSVADSLIRESGIPVLIVRPPSVATGLERGGYRRILVPLDGSVLAEQSIPAAVSLARHENSSVLLLFVVVSAAGSESRELLSPIGPVSQREASEVQSYLDNIVIQYGTRVQMLTRIMIVPSDVPSAILRAADADEADLIAMSSRGRGMMARTLGGSVSDRIMRESSISTLVVHPVAGNVARSPAAPLAAIATA
jgi:nucleotide-binding universal stress UspA family protein